MTTQGPDAPAKGEGTTPAIRFGTRARRRSLVTLLKEPGGLSIHQLAETFSVSPSTVRRDLRALEAGRQVLRVYGGAVGMAQTEVSWHDKEHAQARAKRSIALAAAQLVNDGDLVLLDAGTSTAAVAALLADNETLTLAATGLSSLVAAADGKAELIVVGGRLRRPNAGVSGSFSEMMLDLIRPTKAFMGCDSFDIDRGLNCPDFDQATLKMRSMSRTSANWVLADYTKFRTPARFAYWASLGPTTGVITDDLTLKTNPEVVDRLRELGHEVIIAAPRGDPNHDELAAAG